MEAHIVLTAVATATTIHAVMEPTNILAKLDRLAKAIKTGKIEDPQFKGIDTRAKAYGLGTSMMLVMAVIAYFVSNLIDPTVSGAIWYSVIVVAVGELILMARIDKYHVAIEKVTQDQKKK